MLKSPQTSVLKLLCSLGLVHSIPCPAQTAQLIKADNWR